MKATRSAIIISLALLLIGLTTTARAQAPANTKHFAKDGLVFDYPNTWEIQDESNADAQQLTLARADSDSQIRIFVHRGKVETPEKMAQARKAFIDPYITATSNTLVQMGGKPERTDATIDVGGAKAEGVHLRASLGGEPGEAAIYWVNLNNRVIVLTFFGPDQGLKKATPAWDNIRNSLKIEAPAAPAKK